jgi:hypothetical protein
MEFVNWNRGLLLSGILIVIGGMAVVSARSWRDRCFAVGVLTQGIVVVFAVGGAFHQRAELPAVAMALIVLSALWCLWDRDISHVPTLESSRLAANNLPTTQEMSPPASQDGPAEGSP